MPFLLRKYLSAVTVLLMVPGLLWLVVVHLNDAVPDSVSNNQNLTVDTNDDKDISQTPVEEWKDPHPYESTYNRQRKQSLVIHRRGNLLIKSIPGEAGIAEFNIYRGRRLLLNESNSSDDMWLGFPLKGKRRNVRRTFNGGCGDFISDQATTSTDPFVHFNGDNIPDLIIIKNQGQGGESNLIYSLGKTARLLGTIETIRSSADFMDVDGDGKCEILASDPTFIGWQTAAADSVTPFVILKLGRRGFELATSLMEAPPPSKQQQRKLIAEWHSACTKGDSLGAQDGSSFVLAPAVWSDLLDLIYSGNSKVAFKMLRKFWKPGTYACNLGLGDHESEDSGISREDFEEMLLDRLSCSAYLKGLKRLNKGDCRIGRLVQHQPLTRQDL